MTTLYRVVYVNCNDTTKLHVGPILYLTGRNGSPKKLRPYTREEAYEIANRYNRLGRKQVFHEVEEFEVVS